MQNPEDMQNEINQLELEVMQNQEDIKAINSKCEELESKLELIIKLSTLISETQNINSSRITDITDRADTQGSVLEKQLTVLITLNEKLDALMKLDIVESTG